MQEYNKMRAALRAEHLEEGFYLRLRLDGGEASRIGMVAVQEEAGHTDSVLEDPLHLLLPCGKGLAASIGVEDIAI